MSSHAGVSRTEVVVGLLIVALVAGLAAGGVVRVRAEAARIECQNNLKPRLPGSPHRAGRQVAMADGSVRVFGPDTAAWVFWSACSPEGQTR